MKNKPIKKRVDNSTMTEVELYADITIHEWQKEFHNKVAELKSAKNRSILVIKAARQRYGKTTCVNYELIRTALEDICHSAYVTYSYKLAKKQYKKICKACKPIISSTDGSDFIITFKNGSTIQFYSSRSGDALRGDNVSGILVIDEAAFIPDNIFYEKLFAWTDVHKALTILLSTPQYENGFFYDFYERGKTDSNNVFTFDWIEDYYFPPDELTLIDVKPTMPLHKFNAEFEGIFMSATGEVFEDYSHVLIDNPPDFKWLFLGLDFGLGKKKDWTVLTGFNEYGQQVFIEYFNDIDPVEQIEKRIYPTWLKYRQYVRGFYIDATTIGTTYLSIMKKSGIRNITPIEYTNKIKSDMVDNVLVGIETDAIKLLNNEKQNDDMNNFERKPNKNGTMTYNAKDGKTDDFVNAIMLGYTCYLDKANRGQFWG